MELINIKDKQPEFGVPVLVFESKGSFTVASLWKKEETKKGFEYCFTKGGIYITHWCELPSKPKLSTE